MLVGFMSRTGQLQPFKTLIHSKSLTVENAADAEYHEMKQIYCFGDCIVFLIKIYFILLIGAVMNCQWHSVVAKISHLHYLKQLFFSKMLL